jgi:hypothetical protein
VCVVCVSVCLRVCIYMSMLTYRSIHTNIHKLYGKRLHVCVREKLPNDFCMCVCSCACVSCVCCVTISWSQKGRFFGTGQNKKA